MSDNEEEYEVLEERRICCGCIGEPYLKSEVRRNGLNAKCMFCGKRAQTISIEALADRFELVFRDHFIWMPPLPSPEELPEAYDPASPHFYLSQSQTVATVIAAQARIDELAANEVQEVLNARHYHPEDAVTGEEEPFGADARYSLSKVEDGDWRGSWSLFQSGLKTQTRLYNRTAESVLDAVFAGVAEHATQDGSGVIVEVGPGCKISGLYRARVFSPHDPALKSALARPDLEIGPPPARVARAGRMNAHGISLFYGATSENVALAEVRAPVGSCVVMALFQMVRPLRVLDVEALRSIYVEGSVFDPDYKRRLTLAMFLGRLSEEITMPVMPGDEPSDYIVTQAIADYLADRAHTPIDGILYPSAQTSAPAGRNVALFHKSARVQKMDIPRDTEFDALTERGGGDPSPAYTVWESVPEAIQDKEERHPRSFEDPPEIETWAWIPDRRQPALSLDVSSVRVHHITSVTVLSTPFAVTRHRRSKRKPSG